MSVILHALMVVLLLLGSRGCQPPGGGGSSGEEFRTVGIHVKEPHRSDRETETETDSESETDAETEADAESATTAAAGTTDSAVDDRPPVDLSLPEETPNVIGAGPLSAPRSDAPGDVRDLIRPGGIARPGAISGLAKGETRFFGIEDEGTRIVYVIDVSGSMHGEKMIAAKTQLLGSLETLEPTQQFQIVFYHETASPMRLKGGASEDVYWATSINKTLTRQYLGSVRALEKGTDRQRALLKAVSLSPEVIFFLTDGDGVELDRAKRNRIADAAAGRVRIHCIEFGEGLEPVGATPLKRLAKENGGAYRYVALSRAR